MPFQFSPTGVQIQSQAEIVAELAAEAKSPQLWGPSAMADDPSTRLGQFLNVIAGRFAHLQQIVAAFYAQLDPASSQGDMLALHALMQGVVRREKTFSVSSTFTATTTAAISVPAGFRVRNDRTGDEWAAVQNQTFSSGVTQAITFQAVAGGPVTYDAGDTWTQVQPLAGLVIATPTAIASGAIGKNQESEADLYRRRQLALKSKGNDFQAMIAAVKQVSGVTYVGGFENRTETLQQGVPGRAFEIVVEGGSPTDIAKAILSAKPPGAESHGGQSVAVPLNNGQDIVIRFSRVTPVNITLQVIIDPGDPQFRPPFDYLNLVKNAVLAQAQAEALPGQHVVPDSLTKTVWETTNTADGKHTISEAAVRVKTGTESFSDEIYTLRHTERANFTAANILVSEGSL